MRATLTRLAVSSIFGAAFLLLFFPTGCADVLGPSWERCTSFADLTVPAFTEELGIEPFWNGPAYLAVALAIGWAVWRLQGWLSHRRLG